MGNDVSRDPPTLALVVLAAAIATGDEEGIARAGRAAVGERVPAAWVDELVLQSVLMVGYPRAIVAAGIWRETSGHGAPPAEGLEPASPGEWTRRGEAVCRVVYGANYPRLRARITALHPALDAWMVTEGYGRVLARPGLDLRRRELCSIAQIAVLQAPRQLHSHLRGALHAGASPEEIEAVLTAVEPCLTPTAARIARATWAEVRGQAGRDPEAAG